MRDLWVPHPHLPVLLHFLIGFIAPFAVQGQSAPPGAYNVPGALGRQVMSTKESAPGIKIGSSLRALDYEVREGQRRHGCTGGINALLSAWAACRVSACCN